MRSHGNKRPFKCDKCKKGFKSYNNLKSHLSSHELTDKSFCDICGQSFKHASSLNLHMKLHTGEKKYVCTICGKVMKKLKKIKKKSSHQLEPETILFSRRALMKA